MGLDSGGRVIRISVVSKHFAANRKKYWLWWGGLDSLGVRVSRDRVGGIMFPSVFPVTIRFVFESAFAFVAWRCGRSVLVALQMFRDLVKRKYPYS